MNFSGTNMEVLKNRKILVVDDIPENLKILGTLLRKTGCLLSIATDGQKGVETAKALVPDLILMDINMPGMSGYEACKAIKADPELADIPLIFLTARSDTDDMVHGYSLGALDYITKPFDHTELVMKLVNYMSLKVGREKLLDANQALKTADAAKNKFVSIISHDLRSPMGGILGLMKILVDERNSLSKEEADEFILSIYDTLKRQYEFMEDLLKWGNMQIGRYELKPVDIDLNLFFNNIHELYKSNTINKQISVATDIEPDLKIIADPTMFNSAIANIMSNCIKFTPQGGSISITGATENNEIIISIKDSGVGMEQVIADHIFDPEHFHTTKGTEQEGGSGLGMVLVGDVIKIHKGKIKAISSPGVGTQFIITLPKNSDIEEVYQ